VDDAELRQRYAVGLERLAKALNLTFDEICSFCGDIEQGAWGARRLKEFFQAPEVTLHLDSLIKLSEEYQRLKSLCTDGDLPGDRKGT